MKRVVMSSLFVLFICLTDVIGVEIQNYNISSDELSKEYVLQFEKAMNFVDSDDYKEALNLLTGLKQNNPNNANLEFYLGLCKFYLMFDKKASLEHFAKSSKSISEKYVNTPQQTQAPLESIYFEALSYHYLGQYANAIKLYESYLEKSKTIRSDKKYIKSAQQKIKYCKNPDLVLSTSDLEIIYKKQLEVKPTKQDYAYKNKLSNAVEAMGYDHLEALILFKEMAFDYPNDPKINYFMGICMLNYVPYNKSALGMFEVADKMIVSPSNQSGLVCPSMNRYYMALANQMDGDHVTALKHFEEVDKAYPTKFLAFRDDFNEKMELSRRLTKVQPTEESGNLALTSFRNKLEIKAQKELHVIFPETKPRVELQTSDRMEYSNSGYYYTIQIGEGFMKEEYFDKAPDYRISRLKGSKYPRYVVGKYSSESEATSKMEELKAAGYCDAFVTRYKGRLN